MKLSRWMKIAHPLLGLRLYQSATHRGLEVTSYTLRHPKITSPVRLLYLSDLHNNCYGEDQAELKAMIETQTPDYVLLGGDFFDRVGSLDATVTLLRWLGERYATYFVTGNHELGFHRTHDIKELVTLLGITVLDGRSVELPMHHGHIILSGVDDPFKARAFKYQLDQVGNRSKSSAYHILLSHRPEKVAKYEQYPFDLILSGHAHGGQVRLPGLANGLFAPGQGLFPKYTHGQYVLANGTTLIVSRGLDSQKDRPVPRLFNRPELVVIDLEPVS